MPDEVLRLLGETALNFEDDMLCCVCSNSLIVDQRQFHQHGPWQRIHVACHIEIMGPCWKDCAQCAEASGVPKEEIESIQGRLLAGLKKRSRKR